MENTLPYLVKSNYFTSQTLGRKMIDYIQATYKVTYYEKVDRKLVSLMISVDFP